MLLEPRAARLGDEFEPLYADNFAFAWRMLLHFGVPAHQVEDAVQDVFVVVHRRLDTWDRSVSVRPWICGICRRVAADHRRAHGRHQRKIDALPPPDQGPALDGQVADRQVLALLEQTLAGLDPGPRDAFVMAELEGMSSREIAEATGVNPNTIASRLRKARVAVAKALGKLTGETKFERA
ncbi:RNA polymerase sigma factor [Enhygromyxa salina]|uniref:Putative RNA polymerase sigma factor FecI n=1 Tax=Enhygromyxa salina TaxID=215803 RepID=A0A2S9YWQ5_9BACT|nr:sigma-70 family RNA polymerase sigma factor [Enhygromyxa salina]PRQ09503.1 putative RNA polymerase sigma factor FecI [Enhygromyxa salina]